MKSILTVLGGSSPFTAAMVDALANTYADRTPIQPMELVLTGRNHENLSLMSQYATQRLGLFGWTCRATQEMARGLDGAAVVIHQIRYGGLAQRVAGERLCAGLALPEDETLGAAALLSGIRSVPALELTLAALKRFCPEARVLNMTNPLSTITAIMARELSFCVGLCELPAYTLSEAAGVLGVSDAALDWQYLGLNHRGFIFAIRHRGENLLPQLPQKLAACATPRNGPATIGGIDADCISQMRALPLKYFRLVTCPSSRASGRADFLRDLRARISNELRQDQTRSPSALRERYLEWYPRAVVPMLAALASNVPSSQVVNLPLEDGLVWELKVPVSRVGIGCPEQVEASPPAAAWLERFRIHEQAFLRAVCAPNHANIREAVLADPTVPEAATEALVHALEIELRTPSEEVQDV